MLEDDPGLSTHGERRRDAILVDALRAAKVLKRRRHVQRSAALVGKAALMLTVALSAALPFVLRNASGPLPRVGPRLTVTKPELTHSEPTTGPNAPAAVRERVLYADRTAVIRIVADDPSIGRRYLAPPIVSTIARIDDAALIRTLDDAGMHAGVASVGGTTLLFVDGQAVR